MDNSGFDTLVRHLYVLKNRREGLRFLLASLAAGSVALATAIDAAGRCAGKGERCRETRHCCGGTCKKGRSKENGKVKKGREGRCTCSRHGRGCKRVGDCCDLEDICDAVPAECRKGGGGSPVCCRTAGTGCSKDCDCCGQLTCVDQVCVAGVCLESGEQRRGSGGRISAEGVGTVPCPPDDPVLCCREGETCCTAGPSPDCCPAGTACTAQGCASTCPAGEVACPAGSKKPCCDEDFAECCAADKPFGCCQTGFPLCCDALIGGVGCCADGFQCCQPGDKIMCCPEDQVCCPEGSLVPCASSLAACGEV